MIGADIMRRIFLSAALCGSAFMLGQIPAQAGDTVNTGYFGGVAIMGYDPVAYFTDSHAVKGSEKFAYDWLGTPWHFANEKHREMFMSEPTKYAPQYGGYCAVTMSGGEKGPANPEAWIISDGKLYVFRGKIGVDKFKGNPAEVAALADANWRKLHEPK